VYPVRSSIMWTPLPSMSAASIVNAIMVPGRLNACQPTLPTSSSIPLRRSRMIRSAPSCFGLGSGRFFLTARCVDPLANSKLATLSQPTVAPVSRFISSARRTTGLPSSLSSSAIGGETAYAIQRASSENTARDARATTCSRPLSTCLTRNSSSRRTCVYVHAAHAPSAESAAPDIVRQRA
jgi:hypothetical protein